MIADMPDLTSVEIYKCALICCSSLGSPPLGDIISYAVMGILHNQFCALQPIGTVSSIEYLCGRFDPKPSWILCTMLSYAFICLAVEVSVKGPTRVDRGSRLCSVTVWLLMFTGRQGIRLRRV